MTCIALNPFQLVVLVACLGLYVIEMTYMRFPQLNRSTLIIPRPCFPTALAIIDARAQSVLKNEHPKMGDADISCNLPRMWYWLREVQPAHVTEIGVRFAVSSWTFAHYASWRAAAGLPITYIASDITKRKEVAELDEAMGGCPGVLYSFTEGDDLVVPPWKTDFLFIDTWHTYKQLYLELLRWAPHTRSLLVLHDTTLFASQDEGSVGHGGKPVDENLFKNVQQRTGLVPALNDFLLTSAGQRWEIVEQNSNCNGITFLRANSV